MHAVVHGHGERFAPEPGQEAPMMEQFSRLDFVSERLDFSEKTVLDCGCGTGYSLAYIASRFPTADCVGIDPGEGAIDYAANRYPSMKYVVMNGLDLAFPTASFDSVLSFEVLEHLSRSEHQRYLSEMTRVLRPGGTLVMSTPNRDVFSLGHAESLNPYHLSELTLSEMRRLLSTHFENPTIYGQFFANVAARERDFAQLRSQFTRWKRIKRRAVAVLQKPKMGVFVYTMYERTKATVRGPRIVYPFAIEKADFGFDCDNMNIAKWFVCVCTKPSDTNSTRRPWRAS
jgi:ubiquinone/menaquinone biosynthesis C-methylase UbiE